MNWLPITSAPTDGTKIILYGACRWEVSPDDDLSEPKICVGYWYEMIPGYGSVWCIDTENPYTDICIATHWQPLMETPN